MTKFLLLLGPSGVGKSSIINELRSLDTRFDYISPYITRPLRTDEKDKISVSSEVMDEMDRNKMFLTINEVYGIRYATPKLPIIKALNENRFPILDWPINKISIMRSSFPGRLMSVYVEPPSLDDLRERLGRDRRDINGIRYGEAVAELTKLWSGEFDGQFDFRLVSRSGEVRSISRQIYVRYVESMCEGNSHGKEFG